MRALGAVGVGLRRCLRWDAHGALALALDQAGHGPSVVALGTRARWCWSLITASVAVRFACLFAHALRVVATAVGGMKGSAPGASLRELERLGDLARVGNEVRVHDDWGAEYAQMSPEDRLQLEAAMRDASLQERPMDGSDVEFMREWEALQASYQMPQNSNTQGQPPQRSEVYVFQPGNPFLESANPFQEGCGALVSCAVSQCLVLTELLQCCPLWSRQAGRGDFGFRGYIAEKSPYVQLCVA